MSEGNGTNGEKRAYRWVIGLLMTALTLGGVGAGATGQRLIGGSHAEAAPDVSVKPTVEFHSKSIDALQAKDEKHEARMDKLADDLRDIKGDVRAIKEAVLQEKKP